MEMKYLNPRHDEVSDRRTMHKSKSESSQSNTNKAKPRDTVSPNSTAGDVALNQGQTAVKNARVIANTHDDLVPNSW